MTRAALTDGFGRVHDYLRISLTERCNLRCFYCMPEDGIQLRPKAHFMSNEEVIAIATRFVEHGVRKIRLTGGEPLVRKGIEGIIEGLAQLPVELTITTNAVVVDRFINVFSSGGIKKVNVSLDTLDKARFEAITRRDQYEAVITNIDRLLAAGFQVKVNAVVIKGRNDDEVVDFVRWTQDKPVHVRFIEFMPFDGNDWHWDKKVSYQDMLDQVLEAFGQSKVERLTDAPNDTSKNYRLSGASGTFAFITTVTNPFCDTCNRVRLTADGKVKNCLFAQDELDILSAYRSGQDVSPLILKAIQAKHKQLGGMNSFENGHMKSYENRAMIAIGG